MVEMSAFLRGLGSIQQLGTKIPQAALARPKKKKKEIRQKARCHLFTNLSRPRRKGSQVTGHGGDRQSSQFLVSL